MRERNIVLWALKRGSVEAHVRSIILSHQGESDRNLSNKNETKAKRSKFKCVIGPPERPDGLLNLDPIANSTIGSDLGGASFLPFHLLILQTGEVAPTHVIIYVREQP